jgi:Zn-dependent M28 family amino/carboxypeptidase
MDKKSSILLVIAVILGAMILSPRPGKQIEENGFTEIQLPEQPPPKEHTLDDAINSITKEELKEDLYYLASDDLEGRMTGEKGNELAAEYIKKRLEDCGINVELQKFTASGRKTANVIGWLDGENPNEIVVIGAHFDHIGKKGGQICNGADDNASGTVAVLEIAEAFAMLKGKLKRTVVFQLYSAEEMGLVGSRYYCNNPTFPRGSPNIKNHVFMLNFDMVGYLKRGQYKAIHYTDSSFDLRRLINDFSDKYPFANGVSKLNGGGSDNASFYNKGVPILWCFTGSHRNYHQPTDTAEKINYDGLEKISKYGFEFAWTITQEDDKLRFNWEGFKEQKSLTDHDNSKTPFPLDKEH